MELTHEQEYKLEKLLDKIINSSNEPRAKLKDLRNVLEELINYLEPKGGRGYTLSEKIKYIFKTHPEHRVVREDAEILRTELNDIIHDSDFTYTVNVVDVNRLCQNLLHLISHFSSNTSKKDASFLEDKSKIVSNSVIPLFSRKIRDMNIDGALLGQFVVIDLCALQFYKKYGVDIRIDMLGMSRLESAALTAVKEFCFNDTVTIQLPFIWRLLDKEQKETILHLEIKLNFFEYEKLYTEVGGRLFPKIFRKWDKN